MSDVEFSEEKAYNASLQRVTEKAAANEKSLGNLPIRLGLAKDETGATILLVAVGILALALGVVVFFAAF